MKFRKKPVVVDAIRLSSWPRTYFASEQIREWKEIESYFGKAVEAIGNDVDGKFECLCISIKTLEGTMQALPGDWIIRGVKGEIYPCKPDIFEATYEAVEDHQS